MTRGELIFVLLIAWALVLAVVTPARADALSALRRLCPHKVSLAPIVQSSAERHGADPEWVVALFRAESTCNCAAVNRRTNSIGCLQIKYTGSANPARLSRSMLLRPAVNFDLGAAYLAKLLRKCRTLGGAVHRYHGFGTCAGWRDDEFVARVLGFVEQARGALIAERR